MKTETINNLVWMLLFGMLSIVILALAVIYTAWWHVVTSVLMALLARAMYVDNEYGTESVKDYFRNHKNQ